MIVEAILELFQMVISVLLTPVQFVLAPLGDMSGFIELLARASIFVPMQPLGICLTIWVAFYTTKLGVSIANWLIGKIPTIS